MFYRESWRYSKAISSCLNDELRQDICAMSSRFRSLATFQFHVPSTRVEELFREMDAVAKRGKIPSLQCPAADLVASKNVSPPPVPDSASTIKSLPCIMAHCPSPQAVHPSVRLSSREKGRSKSVQSTRFKSLASQTRVEAWPILSVKPPKVSDTGPLLFIQRVRPKVITITSYHTLIPGLDSRCGIRCNRLQLRQLRTHWISAPWQSSTISFRLDKRFCKF